HQLQQRTSKQQRQYNQYPAADQRQHQRRMARRLGVLLLPSAGVPGTRSISTDASPEQDVSQQVNRRTRPTTRRQRSSSRKPSDDDNVRRVKQHLQNAGQHQRYRKPQYLSRQRPGTHLHLITSGHTTILSSSNGDSAATAA